MKLKKGEARVPDISRQNQVSGIRGLKVNDVASLTGPQEGTQHQQCLTDQSLFDTSNEYNIQEWIVELQLGWSQSGSSWLVELSFSAHFRHKLRR